MKADAEVAAASPRTLLREALRSSKLRLLVTLAVVVVVVVIVIFQWDTVVDGVRSLGRADPAWVGLTALIALCSWPVWVAILWGSMPANPPYQNLVLMQLTGQATMLIPGAPVVIYLRFLRRAGLSGGAAVASMVLLGIATGGVRAALLLVAVAAAPALLSRFDGQEDWLGLRDALENVWAFVREHPWLVAGVALLLGVLALVTAIVVGRLAWRYAEKRGGWRAVGRRVVHRWSGHQVDGELDWRSMKRVLRSPRRSAALWLAALVHPMLGVSALWAMLHAVGSPLSVWDAFVIYMVTAALAALIPGASGAGSRELALVAGLTAATSVPAGLALAAVLGFRLITFWGQIPLGIAAFAYLSRRRII